MNLKLDRGFYIKDFDLLFKTTNDAYQFISYIRDKTNTEIPIYTSTEEILINLDEEKAWMIKLSKVYDFKNFDVKEQEELEKKIALNKLTDREKQLLGLTEK